MTGGAIATLVAFYIFADALAAALVGAAIGVTLAGIDAFSVDTSLLVAAIGVKDTALSLSDAIAVDAHLVGGAVGPAHTFCPVGIVDAFEDMASLATVAIAVGGAFRTGWRHTDVVDAALTDGAIACRDAFQIA